MSVSVNKKPENFDEKVIEIARKNYFSDYEKLGESHFKFTSTVQWCSVEIEWDDYDNNIRVMVTDTQNNKTHAPFGVENFDELDWALFDWGNFYKKW